MTSNSCLSALGPALLHQFVETEQPVGHAGGNREFPLSIVGPGSCNATVGRSSALQFVGNE
jgi:hypothetical protein